MKTVTAIYNYSRWIAICPTCEAEGIITAMEVKPGDVFICPEEYPDILAKTLIPNPRMKGALDSVPDEVLRAETRARAVAEGNAFEVVFPEIKKEIEGALRERPRAARNWFEGVTVADIVQENIERRIEKELPKEEPKEEPVAEEPVVKEPVIEEPITEEPVIAEPIPEEPVTEETIVDEPPTIENKEGDVNA